MHKEISGEECVKILCKNFGFYVIRQKGSHLIRKKQTLSGEVGTVVPAHKELKTGTLKGILELAKVEEYEFEKYVK